MAAIASTTPAADSGKLAFIPLEANPELMTDLVHKLGLSKSLAMHDVLSINEPELLSFIPRPAHALLLVFPVSATYESFRMAEDATRPEYKGKGEGEPVVWFRQTIRNACGLMGLLHAVSNGPVRDQIEPDSDFDKLLKEAVPLAPAERAKLLETTGSLARAHHSAASKGDTVAPEASDDVDLHYVCFVKGNDGTLWELDGRRKGPIDLGKLDANEDVLSEKALTLGPRAFLERGGDDLRFNIIALAANLEG